MTRKKIAELQKELRETKSRLEVSFAERDEQRKQRQETERKAQELENFFSAREKQYKDEIRWLRNLVAWKEARPTKSTYQREGAPATEEVWVAMFEENPDQVMKRHSPYRGF